MAKITFIREIEKGIKIVKCEVRVREENKITIEAVAWMKKYLIIISDEIFLEENIKGIKAIRFISSPIHAVNHDEEEAAIKVPIKRKE